MRVRATDGGEKFATALVTVNVKRNLNAPQFTLEQYTASIQDNEPLASSFTRVAASDSDTKVIYKLFKFFNEKKLNPTIFFTMILRIISGPFLE